jgi:hypothetical protein
MCVFGCWSRVYFYTFIIDDAVTNTITEVSVQTFTNVIYDFACQRLSCDMEQ